MDAELSVCTEHIPKGRSHRGAVLPKEAGMILRAATVSLETVSPQVPLALLPTRL